MKTSIWWVRRDLRLSDNLALHSAMSNSDRVVPLFILDPTILEKEAKRRHAFLFSGLKELDKSLRARGSRLIIRSGKPKIILQKLCEEIQCSSVFSEDDYSPYSVTRDTEISRQINFTRTQGLTIHPPDAIRKQDGGVYSVFTHFRNAWNDLPQPGAPHVGYKTLSDISDIESEKLPENDSYSVEWLAGEHYANTLLENFIDNSINSYAYARNIPAINGTSKLSPYLRFGMISARQVWHKISSLSNKGDNKLIDDQHKAFLDELIWREFFISVVNNFPFVMNLPFRKRFEQFPWIDDKESFRSWQFGETGFPIIDAGMRQLMQTGWMHNRVRMITASFLVKDLLIDWRLGEAFFMKYLVDGDPAVNNGNWQWSAGTGTDAAPYFRIFNPVLQGEKFDPRGDYVRKYVPELERVPVEFIHKPHLMSEEMQTKFKTKIGVDYPSPIVDHKFARDRALKIFNSLK